MAKSKSTAPVVSGGFVVPSQIPGGGPPGPQAQKVVLQVSQPEKNNIKSSSSPAAYPLMIADPKNAPLAPRPDSNSQKVNVERFKDVYDVTSRVDGSICVQIGPNPVNTFAPGATGVGPGFVETFPVTVPSQYQAQLATDNIVSRTLAYVVEWTPTLAQNINQGKACLAAFNAFGRTDPVLNLSVQSFFATECENFAAGASACFIPKGYGVPSFRALTSETSEFPHIVLAGAGFPAAVQVVGQLIVTRIVELVPRQSVLAGSSANHSHCDNMACCVASNVVGWNATAAHGDNPYAKVAAQAMKIVKVATRVYGAVASSGVSEIMRAINSSG